MLSLELGKMEEQDFRVQILAKVTYEFYMWSPVRAAGPLRLP